MAKRDDIEAAEAYAFLKVVAPKLEQLRRRLTAAKDLLDGGDPETARLNAIVESQLALKDFLTAIPDMGGLVGPIDALLEAVREEGPATEAPSGEETAAAPQPEPEPETQSSAPPAPEPPSRAHKSAPAPDDAWLQVGTAIALEKLTNAGMATANAEFYLEQLYATIGLRAPDGAPISLDRIKAWRANVVGPGAAWRRRGLMKRRAPGGAGKGPASLPEVKARVDEIAVMFKKMAPWTSAAGQGRSR